MLSFRGKLEMGSIVEENLIGMLEEEILPNGTKACNGTLVVRVGSPIHSETSGKLILDDGRKFNILVDRFSLRSGIAHFGPAADTGRAAERA